MKKIDESEVLNMASTIQVRVEDELKSKSDAPMTEAGNACKIGKVQRTEDVQRCRSCGF